MKKSLILVLISLLLITGLSGVFSVTESPNGHFYNPTYDQCESYTIVPVTATSISINNLDYNPTIDNTVIYSQTGTVSVTIEDIAGYYYYDVTVDGESIFDPENNLITNYGVTGSNISFDLSLSMGEYNIQGIWGNVIGQSDTFDFNFTVCSQNYYYGNNYAKLFLLVDGVSEYNAIRPTLFIEGFKAPGITRGGSRYTYSLINRWSNGLSDSKVYMMQLTNPTQDARDNSMIVLGALRFIHNVQPSNRLVEGSSVFGYSIGGILARYALAFAEHWDIPHYCTQYISLDSPHRGASLNVNLQRMIENLHTLLSDWDRDLQLVDDCITALNSPAAKQLIRTNIKATNGSSNSYSIGSPEFLEFFSEINEEERSNYGHNNCIINSDQSVNNPLYKPGFPYKQNNIKSLAYSNGSLCISGNNANEEYVASYDLDIIGVFDYDFQANNCNYDTQPGSVIEDISYYKAGFGFDFDLTANYAPVIAPTRSTLFLKTESTTGGDPIPELAISNFTSLLPYEDALLSHTYFDQVCYPDTLPSLVNVSGTPVPHSGDFNQWNWRHGELGWHSDSFDDWVVSNIVTSTNWLNQIENRSVCMIKGQINGSDFSNITGSILINGQGLGSFSIDQNGFYSIPYLYTKDVTVRLVFEKPGCIPSYCDININYSYAMLHDQIAQNVTIYALNLNDIRVSSAGNGSFHTINQAVDFVQSFVDSGLYTGEAIRIRVLPGTYAESVDLSPLAALGITNFTLEGVGDVIINGDGYGIKLVVDDNSPCNGAVYTINSLKIADSGRGILFKDYWDELSGGVQSPQLTLNINNCTVSDCGSSSYSGTSNPIFSAAAIHFEGAGSITSCQIHDNVMTTDLDTYSQYCQAGGLFVNNNTSSETVIADNIFTNNTGALSGGLVAKGKGNILIRNNEFSNNISSWYCDIYNAYEANALSVYDASNILIKDNLFIDNIPSNTPYGSVIGLRTYVTQAASPIKFLNNTIVNTLPNPNILTAIKFRINAGIAVQDIQIRNNIISAINSTGCRIDSGAGYSPVSINNNMLHNTSLSGFIANLYNPDDPNSVYNPSAPRFNYQCDPQLDANYVPIWNATTMSHCIDTGTGVNDYDGTPADIGAKRAVHHQYWEYTFLNQADQEKWYWVSYPVLNSRTGGALVASEFFNELLPVHENLYGDDEPTYLQQIDWREGNNTEETHLLWDENDWTATQTSHYVSSPQGYKIKLLPRSASPMQITLRESGFRTHSNTEFPLYGMNDNAHAENWLGYFIEGSAWPHDVFADIWDDVNMIKTKNWCLVRSEYQGDYWGLHGKIGKLNYGDMVIVTTNNDHQNFQWNDGDDDTPPYYAGTPEHFVYDEKPDYVPLFITIPDEAMANLKEIGLYLDGVCKGAVVVENNIEQISAYLGIDEKLTDGVVDFVFYYHDSKAQHQERKMIRMDAERFSANYVSGNRRYLYYDLAFTPEDMENAVTPEVHLNQNYPNPFNPSTTISYSLPEAGQVRLEIYNLRGQLVKVLANGEEAAGDHRKVWNGTDANGNAVSSGVYFYRLTSPGRTISKRMLLMK
ncbi:MAG: hypothetical protein CVU49_07505 [Candidatus Cloacimonetes bacterium HGW-Cloacimonetes-2]|nr:MAG: hypothetical protein CVU49_07505 [Candidatus Cloacimonetes bacterium HGW-Cloacimonetes-2]